MEDPLVVGIVVGAIGNVGGALALRALQRVWPGLSAEQQTVRDAAFANMESLIHRLTGEVDGLRRRLGSEESIRATLGEVLDSPDFAFTVNRALLAGARTNNAARHGILARAVVERLVAEPDSTQGVASALAVEAVERLSGPQIDVLGLAAFLYYIAPVLHAPAGFTPPDGFADLSKDEQRRIESDAVRESVIGYMEYLNLRLPQHGLPADVTPLDFAHLVSASCASFDRGLHRPLKGVLQRYGEAVLWEGGLLNSYQHRWYLVDQSPGWEELGALWDAGIQHLTLAPAGLIIGAIVHEWKTQEPVEIRWDQTPSDVFTDERPWNGHTIDREFLAAFMRAAENEVRSRLSAGGSPFGFHP